MLRFRAITTVYPRQFWLMFVGMLLSSAGASMIWPFLTIYISERLSVPLTVVASLASLNAACGLAAAFIGGPITDRFGRKWVMTLSLIGNGLVYFFLGRADGLPSFAVLMGIAGAFGPLYRVGGDAMLADLIPSEQRPNAYALVRLSNNLGIAIGPAVGGFITTISYSAAFSMAALGLGIYGFLLAFFANETMPDRNISDQPLSESFAGYGRILRNRPFTAFVTAFTLTQMCATLIWMLMSVYAKQNYRVPENQYGLIATTNAIMVVTLQIFVTRITRRYQPLRMLALGTVFYALGVGSVSLGHSFWGFWSSMVVMTIGELILIPTSSTYAANMAPADMRGRYMSLYGLTWPIAAGIAPLLGGLLSDHFGPVTTWYGGLVIGLIATLGFMLLSRGSTVERPISITRRQNDDTGV